MAEQNKLETLSEGWERALAIAAHPDDLEYGAASAIARWTSQDKQVVYLFVTRGEAGIDSMTPEKAGPLREEEEKRSASIVGVDSVEFLDYRYGSPRYFAPENLEPEFSQFLAILCLTLYKLPNSLPPTPSVTRLSRQPPTVLIPYL